MWRHPHRLLSAGDPTSPAIVLTPAVPSFAFQRQSQGLHRTAHGSFAAAKAASLFIELVQLRHSRVPAMPAPGSAFSALAERVGATAESNLGLAMRCKADPDPRK